MTDNNSMGTTFRENAAFAERVQFVVMKIFVEMFPESVELSVMLTEDIMAA